MKLSEAFPDVAAEWHPTKNGSLLPSDVTSRSGKAVWWLCPSRPGCGCLHEWEATVHSRTRSETPGGCPFCATPRSKICPHNSVAALRPDLLAQWHPAKNGGIDPAKLTIGSHLKVWWRCPGKGTCACPHDWQATIKSRACNGSGCPACDEHSSVILCVHESVAYTHEELMLQWHPSKNEDVDPWTLSAASRKEVWWICPKVTSCGCVHEWKASISSRVTYPSCPWCLYNHKTVCRHESFAASYPDLMAEWHPTRNTDIDPWSLPPKSSKSVWWLCPVRSECGCPHEWKTSPNSRIGSGCPFCAPTHKSICKHSSIAFLHPELMKEWNWERNAEMDPESIPPGSVKKAWWKCAAGHEWKTAIECRTYGSGCRRCRHSRLEKETEDVLTELGIRFSRTETIAILARTAIGVRLDFFLPDHNLIIELDGQQHFRYISFFHRKDDDFKNQRLRDVRLNAYALSHESLRMLRVAYTEAGMIKTLVQAALRRVDAKLVFSNPRLYSGRQLILKTEEDVEEE